MRPSTPIYSKQSVADIAPPLHRSVSYRSPAQASGFDSSHSDGQNFYTYSRWANPTVSSLEKNLAALEGGEDALCFASGMAAITGLLLTTLSAGDHIIMQNVCYPGVVEFARSYLPRFGVDVSFVDPCDASAVSEAVNERTVLIHIESPANPLFRLVDIGAVAQIAKNAGAVLTVDSTIATPAATQPLELGAHYVIHSLTKFLNGHGDAMGGVIIGDSSAISRLREHAGIHLGGVLDPAAAWLILRGLESFEARMAKHAHNATEIASFLERHPRVFQVNYPGLPSHPQHDLAKSQMRNFGAMIAFQAQDAQRLTERLATHAETLSYAVSFGKTKSMIFYLPTGAVGQGIYKLEGSELAKYQEWAGDGVFRLGVGLEDPVLICAELDRLMTD